MIKTSASVILQAYLLKRTSCREGIIETMLEAPHALSENEIRHAIKGNYDRTTFYRSFKTLIEKNVMHRIILDNQFVKYALNEIKSEQQLHAHFFCKQCSRVMCVEAESITGLNLPNGFRVNETELVLKGSCTNCI